MSEMKPCPICGGKPEIETEYHPLAGGYAARIVCRHDDATSNHFKPLATLPHVTEGENVEVAVTEVIKAWNGAIK